MTSALTRTAAKNLMGTMNGLIVIDVTYNVEMVKAIGNVVWKSFIT